jgi:preprotein translocase subunit SecG
LFVGLSITLAVLASIRQAPTKIDTSLVKDVAPVAGAPVNAPTTGDALSGAAQSVGNGAVANQSVPLVK